MVGLGRLELPTSRLSSARSNQLSYKPATTGWEDGKNLGSSRPSQQDPIVRREEKETKTAASRKMPSDKKAMF